MIPEHVWARSTRQSPMSRRKRMLCHGQLRPHEDDEERVAVAVEMVAAAVAGDGARAEHGRVPAPRGRVRRHGRQFPLLVGDGIPDHEETLLLVPPPRVVEEHAAVGGVDRSEAVAVGVRRAERRRRCGDEAAAGVETVGEVAEQRRREAMELAEPAAKAAAVTAAAAGGDEAAPLLAGEGGAGEARGFVGREAEHDIFHELLHQLRRPPRHIWIEESSL